MKCVGLLALLVLIQSVNKFIQLHYREADVEKLNQEFEYNQNAGDERPIAAENEYERGNGISTSSETQNDDSDRNNDMCNEHIDASEAINKGGRGQAEVISEKTEYVDSGDILIESSNLYDEHSEEIFPRLCADGLSSLVADVVENYITSFSNLHSALSGSSKCELSTISTASKELFTIVDSLAKISGTHSSVFSSLRKAVPKAFGSITKVVSGLNIQTLATQLPGTINGLQKLLSTLIQIVNDAEKLKSDIVKKLNTVTIEVVKSVQEIVNTLNVITEATAKAVGTVSTDVQEAVIALSLVFATILVIVQSVCSFIACVLSPLQIYAPTLDEVLGYIDSTLKSIVGVVTSIPNLEPGNMSVTIGVISMTLTYLANDVHSSLDSIIYSSTEPYFSNSLEDLLDRFSEVVGNISSSVSKSVTSVTSSLSVISETPFDILPKVADQINLVYKGLSRVTGTDNIIVIVLINSLPSIFNAIKSALKILVTGIGAEASEALKKYTEQVQTSLKRLLYLVNGSADGNVSIHKIVQEIAKSVQYVVSAVTSITLTISKAISDVTLVVVEAALSLPFIISTILYVAQWVLSAAVSIFNSIAGSVSQILSELTILNSATLENVSDICSTISSKLSDSLEDMFDSIVPYITDLTQLVTSEYGPISGNVLNIVFNIDQILLGAAQKSEKPIAGLSHDTKGNVPEILNTLTGKLISISSELSSTLYSLNNSLKIGSTSESTTLKVISSILVLVLNQVTKVTGSASQILLLISNVLREVFSNLSNAVSKFSVLGDVSVSLNVSVSNIQNALRSLIDAISDCSTDLNILVDPIRNVAKTVQILISSFSAIFDAISQANKDIAKKLSEVITNLPYIVSTIILVVQHVVGAAIVKVLVTFGTLPTILQELALAFSAILQRITSITANITIAQSGSHVNYNEIISNIVSSVSDFKNLASSSLSVISLVLANIEVSLGIEAVE